jgi:hypothetical protein
VSAGAELRSKSAGAEGALPPVSAGPPAERPARAEVPARAAAAVGVTDRVTAVVGVTDRVTAVVGVADRVTDSAGRGAPATRGAEATTAIARRGGERSNPPPERGRSRDAPPSQLRDASGERWRLDGRDGRRDAARSVPGTLRSVLDKLGSVLGTLQ